MEKEYQTKINANLSINCNITDKLIKIINVNLIFIIRILGYLYRFIITTIARVLLPNKIGKRKNITAKETIINISINMKDKFIR